jgi:hypothetical protein
MKRPSNSILWGIVLLLVGLGFLLWNLDLFAEFQTTLQWVLVGLFALVGLGFFVSYLLSREQWWKVIPAFTLLAVAGTIFLAGRAVEETWIALLFFLGLALAFAFIYVTDRLNRWWALLPFGAMGTMVLVVMLGMTEMPAKLLGAILFALMGLVFFLIYALAKDRKLFGWALVPTAALWIMALVALASYLPEVTPAAAGGIRFWPIALIVVGVALLGYGISRAGRPAPIVSEIPVQPAPSETPPAPGAAIFDVPEEATSSSPRRIERSPIALVDTPAASTPESGPPASASATGEVPDIYEFLKSVPVDNSG